MLTEHKNTILRALTLRARPMQDFTNGTLTSLHIASVHVRRYLDKMTDAGLIAFDGHRYSITDDGREALYAVIPTAPVRSYVNSTMREPYRTPSWHVRDGANKHQAFKSRGVGA